jgi:zinc ribbon protein
MTSEEYKFCPRCGTALVPGHAYCPKCGFNIEALGVARDGMRDATGAYEEPPGDDVADRGREPSAPPRSRAAPIVLGALIVAVGLVAFALLMRPPGGNPTTGPGIGSPDGTPLPPGVTQAPSAPITGLTIQTPRDGDTVATKDVTVIGLAPPGLKITRDVSFGLDQHATADGTGHWAMSVSLNSGQNDLVFRIGDDRSTEQRLRVTYTPAG